jgi:hypothetical protein
MEALWSGLVHVMRGMNMQMSRRGSVAIVPALLLLLAGCSAPDAVAEAADKPSAAQVAELEGGVTEAEYQAAFDRFSDCMSAADADLISVQKKNDYLITYSYSAEKHSDGTYKRCYVKEFEQVDTEWQLANFDRSESAKMMRECLAANGVPPTGRAEDLAAQAETLGLDLRTCHG